MHFARFWAYKTKTRSLILETSTRGEPETHQGLDSREVSVLGWKAADTRPGPRVISLRRLQVRSFQNSEHAPD